MVYGSIDAGKNICTHDRFKELVSYFVMSMSCASLAYMLVFLH